MAPFDHGRSADDLQILSFLAEHRTVLERQIAVLLDRPARVLDGSLDALAQAGYVIRWLGFGEDRCCRIQKRGLQAMGVGLRAPSDNLGKYRHDIGVAWLWVLAQRGSFGPLSQVIGERRLHSEDRLRPERPHSVRLGGYDSKGEAHRHYPDLVLVDHQGRRVALELELTTKDRGRRERILAGYGAERRIDGVVYFVERNARGRAVGHAIEASAARVDVADRVHLRTIPPLGPGCAEEAAPSARRARATRSAAEAGL